MFMFYVSLPVPTMADVNLTVSASQDVEEKVLMMKILQNMKRGRKRGIRKYTTILTKSILL